MRKPAAPNSPTSDEPDSSGPPSEQATDVEPLSNTAVAESPFDSEEIAGFDRDDQQAGRAIGKLLSAFFLYTIIVMILAAVWTWQTLSP